MKMYFHASHDVTILFSFWTTTTAIGMLGSCVVVLMLATFYEGLKVFRERLFNARNSDPSVYDVVNESLRVPTDENEITTKSPSRPQSTAVGKLFNSAHFVQTALHVLQIGISYLLMLVFMTYNVWLCLSVLVGAGLGFFAFGGWAKKARIVAGNNEHCH